MNTLIVITALGVLALLSELFNFRKALFVIAITGLMVAIGVAVNDWDGDRYYYNRMIHIDNFSIVMMSLVCALSILWFFFAKKYLESDIHITDKYALILFGLTGALVMVCYNNLCMLFLGIEILSLSMYIMAGSVKKSLISNEAALKYFIIGSFATGFLLLGIALIYGVTGTFHLDTMMTYIREHQSGLPQMFKIGIVLILMAMAFKVSAVPFHYWAPDVYTGSPTMVTAFMATIVKTAAVVAMFRMFIIGFGDAVDVWMMPVVVISILTMLVGNLIATYQNQVKRMLAYSSIAHAGYLLIALVVMSAASASIVFYYIIAYSIASLMAFGILSILSGTAERAGFGIFNGLNERNPLMAIGITIAMLSLAGIPLTAGFFAKYYVFIAALQEQYYALVIVAVLSSLISLYYYFKIIIAVWFRTTGQTSQIEIGIRSQVLIVVCIILLIGMAIVPGVLLKLGV